MAKISFKATQGVYLTYKNYPYKAAQVFGEFIDNSIQSFESNKSQLLNSDPHFVLRVDIGFEWAVDPEDNLVKASKITIADNAAGMTGERFAVAFNLADKDSFREGMNEFGIGMKAASAWFGNNWHVETKSITDNVSRVVDVDITKINDENIEELESLETIDDSKIHGTTILLTNLWPENAILKSNKEKLIKSIASIYRYYLRRGELQLFFDGDLLKFKDYDVLKAAPYTDPDGQEIEWKKYVEVDDHKGHKISGFIALLKDMSDEKRGVVFLRNHRVVMGFDPEDRTVGKDFIGQIGSAKYRRVYGELDLTGFKVSFGKNQVNNQELLESLCEGAVGKLKLGGVNLLTQAAKHKTRKKKDSTPTPPVPPTPPSPTPTPTPTPPAPTPTPTPPAPTPTPTPPGPAPVPPAPPQPSPSPEVLAKGKFTFDGVSYTIKVVPGNESNELFWNDYAQIGNQVIVCKVNLDHPFFAAFGKPDKTTLQLIKALSIAKYKTINDEGGSVTDMMNEFNDIINNQSVSDE